MFKIVCKWEICKVRKMDVKLERGKDMESSNRQKEAAQKTNGVNMTSKNRLNQMEFGSDTYFRRWRKQSY